MAPCCQWWLVAADDQRLDERTDLLGRDPSGELRGWRDELELAVGYALRTSRSCRWLQRIAERAHHHVGLGRGERQRQRDHRVQRCSWNAESEGSILGSYSTLDTTYTVTNLYDGTYYFTIEASNAAGTGPRSTPRTSVTLANTNPSAPTLGPVTIDDATATLAWTAGSAGTSAITSYLVQYSTDDYYWYWWTMSEGSAETSATFDLPSAGFPYTLRVAAVSEAGVGEFVTTRPPIAATDSVSQIGVSSAVVSGSVDPSGGVADTGFELATSVGALGTNASMTVAADPASVTGAGSNVLVANLVSLQPGTAYVVRTVATVGETTVFGPALAFTTDPLPIQTQTITFGPLADLRLDRTPAPLSATSDSGLPVTFSASPAHVCTVIGTTVSLVGEGTCTVTAAQAGDGGHYPATHQRHFTVLPDRFHFVLHLESGQPVAGAAVDVAGSGLLPNSPVRIELHSEPILLGTATTDSSGSFSTTVFFPATVTTGSHSVIATGTSSDGSQLTDSASLFVDWAGAAVLQFGIGGYTAITPRRIIDTRQTTTVGAGHVLRVGVPSGLLPADTTAVTLNVTVTQSTAPGFVTVYPCESVRPLASALNYATGETVSNLVVSSFTVSTELCLFTSAETDVVVDLNGYHSSSAVDRLEPSQPARVMDTRSTVRSAAGSVLEISVVGPGLAPVGSTAVQLFVAVDSPSRDGFLTVFPCGEPIPLASNLNFVAGQTIGNDVIAKIGDNDKVCIYTMEAADIVVDFYGSFGPAGGVSYTGMVPGRLLDTRGSAKIEAGHVVQLAMVGPNAAPSGTSAVSLNVAVDEADSAGFLTVFPCGTAQPWTASLNFRAGQTISSHVTAKVGDDGKVCVYSMSTTHIVVDVEGIFMAD